MSEDTKKEAATTKGTTSTPKKSVPQDGKKVKKRKNEDGGRMLTTESSVRALTIKCYDEQLTEGWDATKERIQHITGYQVFAVKHDKDKLTDDFWAPADEKAHYHFVIRVTGDSGRKIRTILNMLGIAFRPGEDDKLVQEALSTIKRDLASAVMYLTHETQAAINDGKEPYDRGEVVSNLTRAEVDQVRDGYVRTSAARTRLTAEDWEDLKKLVCQLAIDTKSFTEWYNNLPLVMQNHAKMKTLEKMYQNTLDALMSNDPLPECLGLGELSGEERMELRKLTRLCVFIQGEQNIGKTYAAKVALAHTRMLEIAEGGTGRYDRLSVCTDTIILDDGTCPSLLNVCDNYKCMLYRRNSGNPYWCGHYFIVTSNLSFEEWAQKCGIITRTRYGGQTTKTFEALKTRFFICSIRVGNDGKRGLYVEDYAKRGTQAELEERLRMFKEFRTKYDETMANYEPESRDMGIYDDINAGRYSDPAKAVPKTSPAAGRLPVTEDGFIDIAQVELGDIELPFT